MAKKVLQAELSVKGINELKKQLNAYKVNFLQKKLEELTRRLSERGVEIAKTNIATLDAVFTGELMVVNRLLFICEEAETPSPIYSPLCQ